MLQINLLDLIIKHRYIALTCLAFSALWCAYKAGWTFTPTSTNSSDNDCDAFTPSLLSLTDSSYANTVGASNDSDTLNFNYATSPPPHNPVTVMHRKVRVVQLA